jgi:hypothetical protein
MGVGLLYWTWSANKSGKVTVKWSRISREERPILFAANLIGQGLLAIFMFALAVIVLLEQKPA